LTDLLIDDEFGDAALIWQSPQCVSARRNGGTGYQNWFLYDQERASSAPVHQTSPYGTRPPLNFPILAASWMFGIRPAINNRNPVSIDDFADCFVGADALVLLRH
jgi:hypothetical protein